MADLVRADRLTRRYVMGESVITALESFTLTLEEGEPVAVVGRSGSGKSTLLHLLGGLDRPTSGDVFVRGRRLAELSDDELALYRRSEVGFVFQSFHLVPSLSAARNVELALTVAGRPPAGRRRRADELLDRVGLSSRRGHRPSELSGGEQQRVAVARALANDPPILLADEPTGNLDTKTSGEILSLLAALEGRTVIVVTHDRILADSFARRVVELKDGQVVSDERR